MRGYKTMQIKLDYYEILEALEAYLLDKHNIKCSLNDNPDYPYRFVVCCPECKKALKGSASTGVLFPV